MISVRSPLSNCVNHPWFPLAFKAKGCRVSDEVRSRRTDRLKLFLSQILRWH